jgi:DNA helicase-2/ATP-dependent DNA helicase PcrA
VWAGGDAFLCSALCFVAEEPLQPLPSASELGLKPRAAAAVVAFRAMLARWRVLARTATVAELLVRVIEDTGYKEHILGKKADGGGGGGGGGKRWDNVQQLLAFACELPAGAADGAEVDAPPPQLPRGLDALSRFLDDATLRSASDGDAKAEEPQAVWLLTMHSAKGLEFEAVFCIGLEDGIIPSERSLSEALRPDLAVAAMEEERRLMYVAVTRAKRLLYLCRAEQRQLYSKDSPLLTCKALPFLARVETALGHDESMVVKRYVERV